MKIVLIPTVIADETEDSAIPIGVREAIKNIEVYFTENVRTARRYLSKIMKLLPEHSRRRIQDLHFEVVDKDTSEIEIVNYFKTYENFNEIGVLSESGCPGIADPGSLVVKIAHHKKYQVIPMPGPSSVFLALMASGMNGQNFVFHGYLPVDEKTLVKRLSQLESSSVKSSQTQIFIETPYRNQRMLDSILKSCRGDTNLCVALDITGASEFIRTNSIDQWRKSKTILPRLPSVFLLN